LENPQHLIVTPKRPKRDRKDEARNNCIETSPFPDPL
jgi:hypothetical protein